MKGAFMIRDIDQALWKEFKAACAHFDISIKGTFLKHIQNIVNDYRIYKMNFGEPKIHTKKGGKQ